MMKDDVEFFLYTKSGCSPCVSFRAELDADGVRYHLIDIAGEPELLHRYGARVPVLVSGNVEICAGTFNKRALAAYLHGAVPASIAHDRRHQR
jgi:hypothetical protein